MKPLRLLVRLLGMMLWASSFACLAAEAAKPAEPAKATPPAVQPAPAASPADAAKNAKPVKAPAPVKPPDEAKLRATISRALAFLAKEGDEWITDKNCNSCHHMPELLWSHREAKRRGFPVDQKKFDEWLAWSNERAPNKKQGGLEELAFMILAMPEQPAPTLARIIAADQKPDGTWAPAGQFADMQARGAPDATANAMHLFLLALSAPQAAAEPAAGAALTKATARLQKKDPPKSVESLVFRTLYAERLGKPEESAALRADILKLQRGDGGWSYVIGANQSDPLATGQALYILQPPKDPKTADAIARAQHWLMGLQRPDGSWPIDYTHISKMDRSDPQKASSAKNVAGIYHFWGSSWATIGLLQGVPLKEATPRTAQK